MIEGHIIFNAILYSIVIAYILYINFSAYYQTGTGFLRALVNLFQNWIFRTVYLLIVGFFALDLFPYGGFVLAILLTIAFLNTNMLMYKKDVEESFTTAMKNNEEEKNKKLPLDVPVQQMAQPSQQGSAIPPAPSSLGIQSNSSMIAPPAPMNIQPQMGQPQMGQPQMGQPQTGQSQMGQPQMGQPQMGQPQMGQPQMIPSSQQMK